MAVLYGYVIGMPPWDSHGIALLLLHRSSMEVPYVQYLWNSPMWLLWDWMGIDHWEFHGMALWAMHWDPMDLHWGCSLRIPWKCSMGRSLGCPHGTPMGLHCYCSIGAAWKCLMCNTFGIPPVASVGLGGD